MTRTAQALIVGGGISGITASIRLGNDAGLEDVLILEKSQELGGTWAQNTYPGCACDIPSGIYSFLFEPNPDWHRIFAEQPEIRDYLNRVAAANGVPERTVFGAEVLSATWDDAAQLWRLATTRGDYAAPILVFAPGPLHEPRIPEVPGLDRFQGASFHSAAWDHDHDLSGENVAVVGTGASAIQFVPRIAPGVKHLTILQRTPGWVWPKPDIPLPGPVRSLFHRLPVLVNLLRWSEATFGNILWKIYENEKLTRKLNVVGRAHLWAMFRDRTVRKSLTPHFTTGCKRLLLSNEWYPTLKKPHVDLVPHGLREVRERSVVAADGTEHPADTIIWATGFHASDLPFTERVRGSSGQTLADYWDGNPSAYLGSVIAGYPNAFMMFGPNSATTSAFVMAEAQCNHMIAAIDLMRKRDASSIDVKPQTVRRFKDEANRRLSRSAFGAGGCTSWYMDRKGEQYTAYPGTMSEFYKRSQKLDEDDYELTARAVASSDRVPTSRSA